RKHTERTQGTMSVSGRLKTMDLQEVLQWVTTGKKTGALAVINDAIKVAVYFSDGIIIASRSNDPTKQLGQFLLFQGKITEQQLKRAFEIQHQTAKILGKILVEENIVSQEEIECALKARTEEIFYDMFLWEDGHFNFMSEVCKPDDLIQINMDVSALLVEGLRRKDVWSRIRSVIPGNDAIASLREGIDLKTLSLTTLQKKLSYFLTLKKPVSKIILELHGSEFLVKSGLLELFENGIIEITQAPAASGEESSPVRLFNKGLAFMQSRLYKEAIAAFEEVVRLEPQNTWAAEQIDQAERLLCQEYYRTTVPPAKIPYFLVSETDLAGHKLTHEEAFIASRINGTWDIKAIVMLSPLREIEILQVLEKLLKMRIIALK
ncbi:MAG TPA: DUF4388 domain-containing protein, partial [Acidobacteriota bacterium]|nr:DUF4388 domain-containing protein [Acidobacteriota bacterium]